MAVAAAGTGVRGLTYVGTEIPASHCDLVECPPVAAMTTVMPDGTPQTSAVWCDFDGAFVRVNTMRGFQKEKNLRRNPRVTLLCYDPKRPYRYLEVRGTVEEMTEHGASAAGAPSPAFTRTWWIARNAVTTRPLRRP
jgi:PPOX class probable F420-dependent enzyme